MGTTSMALQQYALILIPLVLSLAITPLVIAYARKVGAMDQPNERKVHKNPVPRLGGVAIYASFFLALVVALSLDTGIEAFAGMTPKNGVMLVISLTLVLLLGIWDDLYQLSPGKKFLGQLLAGLIVYFAGFRISAITHPFSPDLLTLGWWDLPATLLWVVGITNAINLIDGLDGLAGGVAMIVSLTMAAVASLKGDTTTAMMALLLAGSILGFLRYNFNGARIFLGDSGSLFLGFALAILSIRSSTKGTTAFSIIVPMLALGLPIMDTFLSMIRRLIRSVLPQQQASQGRFGKLVSMFLPDRGHIHHRLIDRGLSHRNVVLILYVVSCCFGLGAFAVTVTNDVGASLILFTIGAATFIGVSQLRYKEMAVLRNGVLLPMYEWPLMNSSLFHGFLDIAFMVVAYMLAHWLSFRAEAAHGFDRMYSVTLAAVGGIQLLVFYVFGMYRGTFRQMGIGDLLKILKTVTLAVGATFLILSVIPNQLHHISLALVVLDFYVLLSLSVGARISFLVLHYLSQREVKRGGKQVLIYGAGTQGLLVQQRMLADAALDANPVGFLDDDPSMEGKRLNGLPVFGGHWRLQRLINTMKIDEVHIAAETVNPEVLARLVSVTRANNVALRSLKLQLEEVQPPARTPSTKIPLPDDFVFVGK
jgi:UDP-GlcNAc:undecaprenyl-phosphate GlcNAc-1-phosphate transferase